jgi:FkbM family methyltransferase
MRPKLGVLDRMMAFLREASVMLRCTLQQARVDLAIAPGVTVVFSAPTSLTAEKVKTLDGESSSWRVIVERLRDDDCFWDVGANFGLYAIPAARVGARVVAFEPVAAWRGMLISNKRLNGLGRLQVMPVALGDHLAIMTLVYKSQLGSGMGGDAAYGDEWIPRDEAVRQRAMMVRGVDLVESGAVPAPTVMKVDVEGGELGVLRGMGDLLKSEPLRAVFCELHRPEGPNSAVMQLLESAGFRIVEIEKRRSESMILAER